MHGFSFQILRCDLSITTSDRAENQFWRGQSAKIDSCPLSSMMPSGTTEELPAIEVQPELFKFTHLLRFWIRPWNLRRKRPSVVPGNDPGNIQHGTTANQPRLS